ncbi:hypothetical protein V8F20_004877 [Naviculisporaceae sp. PSN 640]
MSIPHSSIALATVVTVDLVLALGIATCGVGTTLCYIDVDVSAAAAAYKQPVCVRGGSWWRCRCRILFDLGLNFLFSNRGIVVRPMSVSIGDHDRYGLTYMLNVP